jgi:hypothetical protein
LIADWASLRALALSLVLPEVTEAQPWGHEVLKAFGKLWCYWAYYEDAAVFKAGFEEREMLMQADPATFFLHPHFAPHKLVLVRAGHIDPDWAKARLVQQWRDAAPKRFLRDWDARA